VKLYAIKVDERRNQIANYCKAFIQPYNVLLLGGYWRAKNSELEGRAVGEVLGFLIFLRSAKVKGITLTTPLEVVGVRGLGR
jgi:hypothetical protein